MMVIYLNKKQKKTEKGRKKMKNSLNKNNNSSSGEMVLLYIDFSYYRPKPKVEIQVGILCNIVHITITHFVLVGS